MIERETTMKKTVISVIGRDTVGIIAKVSAKCAEYDVNIIDISQTVMKEFFTMTMLVDTSDATDSFGVIAEALKAIDDEYIKIYFNNEVSPCVIKPCSSEEYLYLILPVRITR